jgi:glycosyltransferase involved in cell wall biosynthesis
MLEKQRVINNFMKFKVAYFRTIFNFNLKSGGSVGHTAGVINGFSQIGGEVTCFTTDKLLGVDEEKTQITYIYPSVFFNTFPKFPLILYHIKFVRTALPKMNDNPPDFIYQRYSAFNFSGVTLSRLLNVPLVIEFNSSEVWKMKYWEKNKPWLFCMMERIENLNLKAADLVVVVSNVLKNDLLKQGLAERERILVNPNCVDSGKFFPSNEKSGIKKELGIRDDSIVIGFSGTFHFWHGVSTILETINRINALPASHPVSGKLQFLLIGDGPQKKEIEEKVGDNKNVIFTGEVPYSAIQDYLNLCDILISPHLPQADGKEFFGSPTKMFEYMAMGKGIIASRLGQIEEVLEHNRTAWLVKPGDAEELTEGILRLASNKEMRERLGENARIRVLERYTWEKNVERVVDNLKM